MDFGVEAKESLLYWPIGNLTLTAELQEKLLHHYTSLWWTISNRVAVIKQADFRPS
jgi:hypothetical protein